MSIPSIYLTVPNTGWLHKQVHFRVCEMISDRRFKVRHACPSHKPFVDNLHACNNDFLEGGEDFWLSIDSDNPPLNCNPLELSLLDLDCVGCPTPVWHSQILGDRPFYYNVYSETADGWIPAEPTAEQLRYHPLQRVDAIGTGCFMVSRRLMLEMGALPFMREWSPDTGRVVVGNDLAFSRRVREKGFQIWAHWNYTCDHFNELPLREVIASFAEMRCQNA